MFCTNGMPNNQKTPGHYNPLLFVVVVLRAKNPGILPIYIVDEKFELTNSTNSHCLHAAFRADFRSDLLPYDKEVIICIKVFHFWLNYTTFFQ